MKRNDLKTILIILVFTLTSGTLIAQDKLSLSLQLGHSDRVTALTFSPDDRYILSGSQDGVLILWDMKTGVEMQRFQGHEGINDMAISKNGKYIVSGSNGKEVKIWEIRSGKELNAFKYGSYVTAVAFSPDDKLVYAAGASGVVKVWDITTGAEKRAIGTDNRGSGTIRSIGISPDGTKILTGYDSYPGKYANATSEDNVILRDAVTGGFIRDFIGHKYPVQVVGISANGKYMLSAENNYKRGNAPNLLITWDLETGAQHKTFYGHQSTIREAIFSPDSKYILTGSLDQTMRLWSVQSGQEVRRFAPVSQPVYAVAFSNDQKYVIAGSDNQIVLWTIEGEVKRVFNAALDQVKSAAFSPDGKHVFTGHGGKLGDNRMRSWDLETGKLDMTFYGPTKPINSIAFTPDGKKILTATEDNYGSGNNAWIWRSQSSAASNQLGGHDRAIAEVDISSDGIYGLTAGDFDEKMYVWNINTIKARYALTPPKQVKSAMFSPDDAYILASAYNSIKIWQMATGREFHVSEPETGEAFGAASFTPDSKHFMYGVRSGDVITKNISSNSMTKSFKIHDGEVRDMDLSPDGKLAVSTSFEDVKVWDINTGVVRATISGQFLSAAFAQSKKQIVITPTFGPASIWDYETGKELVKLLAPAKIGEKANWLTITPDNYFYGTKEMSQSIFYVGNGKVYSFEQFDLQYNRPDIVMARLGYASPDQITLYKRAWEKRIRKMGFSPADFEKEQIGNVPVLTFKSNTGLFEKTNNKQFNISFKAQDDLYRLARLFVSVNGVPIYGMKGRNILGLNAKVIEQNLSIPLSQGKNAIRVSVMNEKGVESLVERMQVTYAPDTPIVPDLHVIAIGVSQFVQSDYNLTYADKDANDLVTLMKGAKGYGQVYVHHFTNEQATASNILSIRSTLEKTEVDDHVIVFVASHGLLDDELNYYIAMHNTQFNNPKVGGLRYDKLEALLDGIPARNKLMLLDACHSGEIDKEESTLSASNVAVSGSIKSRGFKTVQTKSSGIGLQSSFELMKELFADLRRNNGAVVISSASGKEFAFESSEWQNGVFTYALLEGIKYSYADTNKNKVISVSEIRNYVDERVVQLTNGKQHPTSRTENLENDFVVW